MHRPLSCLARQRTVLKQRQLTNTFVGEQAPVSAAQQGGYRRGKASQYQEVFLVFQPEHGAQLHGRKPPGQFSLMTKSQDAAAFRFCVQGSLLPWHLAASSLAAKLPSMSTYQKCARPILIKQIP